MMMKMKKEEKNKEKQQQQPMKFRKQPRKYLCKICKMGLASRYFVLFLSRGQ